MIEKEIIIVWLENIYEELRSYAIAKVGPDLGDEILDNAIEYVLKNKKRLESEIENKNHLKNYIKWKTKNEAYSYYRKQSKTDHFIDVNDDTFDFEISANAYDENNVNFFPDQYMDLKKAMGMLDSKCRELLTMKYVDGSSESELSRVLGVAIGTVGSRTTRCMQKVRELYTA